MAFLLLVVLWAAPAPVHAQTPNGPETTVEYDAQSGSYIKVTRLGDMVISREYMTFEEYQSYQMDQLMKKYWNEKSAVGDTASDDGLLSRIPGFSEISKKVDGLLAIPDISINPTGSADLTFQIVNNFRDDYNLDANRRSVTRFDFDENIQVSLNAKIGDLFDFDINWNTQATFDFENKIKLKYEGKEDDILQLFEAANISFPLNTTLIHGSQELFGVHTKLKFGKLTPDTCRRIRGEPPLLHRPVFLRQLQQGDVHTAHPQHQHQNHPYGGVAHQCGRCGDQQPQYPCTYRFG